MDSPEPVLEKNDETKIDGVGKDILMYFENLNWDVVDKQEYRNCLSSFIPHKEEFQSKSHALKLIDSRLVPFPEKPYLLPPIPDNEEEVLQTQYYVPGVDVLHPRYYPNGFSCLNWKEQGLLFKLHYRKHLMKLPLNQFEQTQFTELARKATHDHPIFQEFVKNLWIKNHFSRCLEVPQQVQHYIQKLWETRVEQSIAMYPHSYKVLGHVPLSLNDPNQDFTVMEYSKSVYTEGTPQKMTVPSLRSRCGLVTDFNSLCQIKAILDKDVEVKSLVQPTPPVSLDTTVDLCIERENVDVVISSSGIKTIVDINQLKKEWILPVTIKNICKIEEECGKMYQKKVVIIDKDLPPSAMSIHDKNKWYNKIASKRLFIQPPLPVMKGECQSTTTDYFSDTTTDDKESFGIFGVSAAIQHERNNQESPPSTSRGKKSESGAVKSSSSLVESDDHVTVPSETGSESKNEPNPNEEMLEEGEIVFSPSFEYNGIQNADVVHGEKHKSMGKLMRHNLPKSPGKKSNSTTCVNYSLWQLHKSKHFNMSKQEQRNVNVLVRTRTDGKLAYYMHNKRCINEVCMSSKVEFQPEYGAARMSQDELLREYVDLYLRQSAKLCRVRTVGHTQELMWYEIKSLKDVRKSFQAEGLTTQRLFDPMYAVLTKLLDQQPGKYLLHHTPKMGHFTQLLVADSHLGANFHLSKHYEQLSDSGINVPPVMIDPFVLTKLHQHLKLPPALLKPDSNKRRFFRKPKLVIQTKKRKKKKKKAGKNKNITETTLQENVQNLTLL